MTDNGRQMTNDGVTLDSAPDTLPGIQFECRQCGKCCKGMGYVYMTTADRIRLSEQLGLSVPAFTSEYCSLHDGTYHLNGPEQDCMFLQQDRCSVYDARPFQCRQWPFWPQNLNPEGWKRNVLRSCEGVGHGKLYAVAEIAEIANSRG